MLKKLVKHGNSSALILDRSILALLDIDENSVVKMRIEGDTLLIKAADKVKTTDSLKLEVEALHERAHPFSNPSQVAITDAIEENTREYCEKLEKDPASMELIKEWLPGTENASKLQGAFSKIMEKYQKDIQLLGSDEFSRDISKLKEQFQGDPTSKSFLDEVRAIRLKHAPNLAKMDKEMEEAAQELGCPEHSLCSS